MQLIDQPVDRRTDAEAPARWWRWRRGAPRRGRRARGFREFIQTAGHGSMDVGHMTSAMSSLSSQVGGSMRHTASSGGSSGMSGSSGGGGGGRW